MVEVPAIRLDSPLPVDLLPHNERSETQHTSPSWLRHNGTCGLYSVAAASYLMSHFFFPSSVKNCTIARSTAASPKGPNTSCVSTLMLWCPRPTIVCTNSGTPTKSKQVNFTVEIIVFYVVGYSWLTTWAKHGHVGRHNATVSCKDCVECVYIALVVRRDELLVCFLQERQEFCKRKKYIRTWRSWKIL